VETTVADGIHEPNLWITAFADAGYDCEMIVWVGRDGLTRPGNTRAQYNWALAETLERAGIEIPRPRQEVVLARHGPMAAHQDEAASSSASST